MNAPQVVVIVWLTIVACVGLLKHGTEVEVKFGISVITVTGWSVVLWWGGFWS